MGEESVSRAAEQDREEHAYLHENGIPHEHHHGHVHSHTQTRAVVNRLARAIGHLERVKAMLAAVRSAINNTGKVILKDHLEHCVVDAVRCQNMAAIEELNRAIEQFVK